MCSRVCIHFTVADTKEIEREKPKMDFVKRRRPEEKGPLLFDRQSYLFFPRWFFICTECLGQEQSEIGDLCMNKTIIEKLWIEFSLVSGQTRNENISIWAIVSTETNVDYNDNADDDGSNDRRRKSTAFSILLYPYFNKSFGFY